MGLTVNIYRGDYDCELNVFYGKKSVTVTNISGPFTPNEDRPAAKLVNAGFGNGWIIVPDDDFMNQSGPQMSGGTFAASSDSRFSEATGQYGAISIHDRRETWAEYNELSR